MKEKPLLIILVVLILLAGLVLAGPEYWVELSVNKNLFGVLLFARGILMVISLLVTALVGMKLGDEIVARLYKK